MFPRDLGFPLTLNLLIHFALIKYLSQKLWVQILEKQTPSHNNLLKEKQLELSITKKLLLMIYYLKEK